MKKILVAMSGGVDSAVTALLIKKQGYSVCGVTLILNGNYEEARSAAQVAERIGIDFFELDCTKEFCGNVIEPFIDCYCSGKTPNPCIMCNRTMKFGILYDEAIKRGFDGLATGHYARISWDDMHDEPILEKALDFSKDQSYVLYSIDKDRLKNIYFPLGEHTKDQVRKLAKEAGFENADKAESQDICFIKDGDYAAFIEARRDNCKHEGNFVDTKGNILGKHKGIINYTVGQRRGLGIASTAPLYVLKKDLSSNSIVLGFEDELHIQSFEVRDVNILRPSMCSGKIDCTVRTRYHQKETECTVMFSGNNAIVNTNEPIRMPASGQSAVFYIDDIVIAGGIIV